MSKKWETITFDQIRKGDRLKVTRLINDMSTVYLGVADHMNEARLSWFTKYGWFVAGRVGYTIERRIVKPAPEPLPTKAGSVIIVHEINGQKLTDAFRAYFMGYDGDWVSGWNRYSRLMAAKSFTKWEHASVVPAGAVGK